MKDWSTISYLIGVVSSSFMSSTAIFSLFHKEILDRREKVDQIFAKVVEKQRGKKSKSKKKSPVNLGETIGQVVMKTSKRVFDVLYGGWFFANAVPVVISIFLAFVVSAPVAFPNMQDWTRQRLVSLLKIGVWGLLISLGVQVVAIALIFILHWMVGRLVSPKRLLNQLKKPSRH